MLTCYTKRKMKQRVQLLLAGVGVMLLAVLFAQLPAFSQAVSQSYIAATSLQTGMIVQLDESDNTKVRPATHDKSKQIHGVVVAPNDTPLSLTETRPSQQVYVATTGRYQVLVSDQNGIIEKGDYITVSSLDGVGMKASSAEEFIVGKSLGTFGTSDDVSNVRGQTVLRDTNGNDHTVHFGFVTVEVGITSNPLSRDIASNLPGFLQKASESVANKPVSNARVYLSLVVMLITALIVGSILYAGVRTSLISLGRNPLAKRSITHNLFQVILVSFIVLILGLFGVYLLLKL